jgi:hypothetical protein
MNILLIQERGRHEANREFREALSMQRALQKLGHQTRVWGLGYEQFAQPLDQVAMGADAIVLLEQYDQTGWVPDFSWFRRGPRVFWTVDSHCNLVEHQAQVRRQKITHLLSSTRGYLPAYEAPHKYWFPNCYDDTLIYPLGIKKEFDIGFCGNICNRGPWLESLSTMANSRLDIFVIGEAMVRVVNSYKIHFNRNIADDINYRTFETAGCGTCLLTNPTPGLEELFVPGEEVLTYWHNIPGAIGTSYSHILRNDPYRIWQIAENGYRRAKRDHTYLARAKRLVEILCTTG